MSNNTRRGFHPKDLQQFSEESLQQLRTAEEEVVYLLNRGYGDQADYYFCRESLSLIRTSENGDYESGMFL